MLARDSNAAPSVLWPEQRWLGELLSTEHDGAEYDVVQRSTAAADDTDVLDERASAPSALCHALRALCVGVGLFMALAQPSAAAESAGMAEPDGLIYVTSALFGLANALVGLVVSSAREALRPGGALQQLGAGEVMISAEDAASNARWRKGLLVFSTFWALLGLLNIAGAFLELPPFVPPGAPVVQRITVGLLGLVWCTVFPVAFSGWWASMRTASCLCRDETIETIHAIETTDPADSEWHAAVAERALGLIPKLKLLSDGWSGGLIGMGLFPWVGVLGYFTVAINTPLCDGMDAATDSPPGTTRATLLVLTAIQIPMPFLMALDVAHTSTYCDLLVEKLNDARAKYGPESNDKITWLETTLLRLVRLNIISRVS